jgi:uncharacterized protein (DUF885 family)
MILALAGALGHGSAQAQAPSKDLAALAEDFWQASLSMSPVMATSLGDRRYDAYLSDNSPEGIARNRAIIETFLGRARAIPAEGLNAEDKLTRQALLTELESSLAQFDCQLYTWVVDPLWGPHVSLFTIESQQPVRSVEEGRNLVKRWRAMGPYLDNESIGLKIGLSQGKVAVRSQVEKTISNIEETLAKPDAEWALLKPLEKEHPDWTDAERKEFDEGVRGAVKDVVRPALERYLAFLKVEILPKARSNDTPGLVHLPGGVDCYQNLIKVHTSLTLAPDQVHEIGLAQVEKINAETQALGKKVFGIDDRQEVLKKLRTDKSLYFTTRDEVEEKAEKALAKARSEMPKWFGILPKADCVVTRMEPFEEKHSTIAYYRQPALDGSRPGQYYINTYAPDTRPRYEAEALAYHEAIPGHHLQIAIAQELEGIPEFRKHTGVTAFVEGWGLYTERLSNEMGLYTGDLDRIGMLSYDSWRACRLVVDTGIHAKKWTRQQAIDFMLANTCLAENNIVNEVDRYITWPGQALAYKLGQLEILSLREGARKELGDRFDIKAYHDAVLKNGAVSLEALREAVRQYVASAKKGAAVGGRTP